MQSPSLPGRRLFAAALFVAAILVLALQFVSPSRVVVSVGETGTTTTSLGNFFTYRDAAVVAVAGCVLGTSGTYLLTDRDGRTDATGAPGRSEIPTTPDPVPAGASETPSASEPNGREPSDDLLERRREEWAETAERLANNEREIYETVLDADGVLPQSEVVERTDLSKATVSRGLDSLETKNLVERKRRGMGNVVLLL